MDHVWGAIVFICLYMIDIGHMSGLNGGHRLRGTTPLV